MLFPRDASSSALVVADVLVVSRFKLVNAGDVGCEQEVLYGAGRKNTDIFALPIVIAWNRRGSVPNTIFFMTQLLCSYTNVKLCANECVYYNQLI